MIHCVLSVALAIDSTMKSIFDLLGVLMIFIIVLVLCYLTTRFVAAKSLKQKNTGNFEVLETYMLAKDRYLQLVRIGEKYYVLGLSKDNINMLTEVSENEVILTAKSASAISNSGFSDVLKNLLNRKDSQKN